MRREAPNRDTRAYIVERLYAYTYMHVFVYVPGRACPEIRSAVNLSLNGWWPFVAYMYGGRGR